MRVVRRAVLAGLVCAMVLSAPALANDYTPSGTITANSDFTPQANGYSFENYGNEGNPKNLGADEMRKLFGGSVCVGGAATGECNLIPAAKQWRDSQNSSMSGGHCEGFAVTASFFYAGVGDPSSPDPLGSSTVPGLAQGTEGVQSHIAYGYVFQNLGAVSGSKVNGSPAAVLDDLAQALPSKEPVVLGIYKRGFKGGHAITPIAIEDRGNGVFAILVYDNNYPNTTRAVIVDRNANTWNYTGSTNPAEAADKYEGDASSNTLEVEHVRNGLGVQPCPFCGGSEARGLADGVDNAQVIWSGDSDDGEHSEVEIEDKDGYLAYLTEDGIVNEIPGANVIPVKAGIVGDGDGGDGGDGGEGDGDGGGGDGGDGDGGDGDGGDDGPGVAVWDQSAPPQFEVPTDLDFSVNLDARNLEGESTESVTVARRGVSWTLEDLAVESGDTPSFDIGDDAAKFDNDSEHGVQPTLSYGNLDGSDAYEVTVETDGIDDGAEVTLDANTNKNKLKIEFDAGKRDTGQVQTTVRKINADGDVEKGRTKNAKLDGGEDGTISYSDKALRDGKLELK